MSSARAPSAPEAVSSGQMVTSAAQRAREPDERQTDERRRILALDILEQRYAQPFGLETARAVVGLLAGHVALDLSGTQRAKHDRRRIDVGQAHSGVDAEQRAGGVEARGLATEGAELVAAARRVAGFAEQPLADRSHLIAPDHQSARVQSRNGLGLREREAQRAGGRRFPLAVRLG